MNHEVRGEYFNYEKYWINKTHHRINIKILFLLRYSSTIYTNFIHDIFDLSHSRFIFLDAAIDSNMAEGRMNLAALQQRDPYITEILDTASQVALYSFNSKSSKWVCIDVLRF